jgi:hypothetical protein
VGERLFDDEDSTFSARRVRLRYRRYFLAFLRNQMDTPADTPAKSGPEDWRGALAAEIVRFESDPGRVAWSSGLPAVIEHALEPFRERLEATYSESLNCFELPPRDASWSFSGDRRRPAGAGTRSDR